MLAIAKGHIQTEEDLQLKKHILEVACQGQDNVRRLNPSEGKVYHQSIGYILRRGNFRKDGDEATGNRNGQGIHS